MELIISLLSGALGGNVAGALLKKFSLGTLWNSVVGILGGGLGAQLLGMLNQIYQLFKSVCSNKTCSGMSCLPTNLISWHLILASLRSFS